jgi:LmbE family N-acetylglucosaminyl deacetylase
MPQDTVMMIWAHYDDDLVFANPTLLNALESGNRAHAFFLTASDAGAGMSSYSEGREAGIRAAYDWMRGASGPWTDRRVTLPNGVSVTRTHPEDDDNVSLSFLRLPDGGLTGGGYRTTGYQSLPKLLAGEIPSMTTVDTGQVITLDLLRSTIAHLVLDNQALTVISNHPGYGGEHDDDHPDHQTVGRLVASVVDAGDIRADIMQYAVGYSGSRRPANIAPDILLRKLEAFASYAAHDPVVAREHVHEYLGVRGFGEWLQRHYLEAHSTLQVPEPVEPVPGALRHPAAAGGGPVTAA